MVVRDQPLLSPSTVVVSAPFSISKVHHLTVSAGKELAQPPSNSTLKYIALGFGIQNYTCAEVGADPTATGALAMLYDATSFYPGQSESSLSMEAFNQLTVSALYDHEVPLNLAPESDDTIAPGALVPPFTPDAPLTVDGVELPFAGHHFFNGESVPQFRIQEIDFLSKKLDSCDAPADADEGIEGTGAVGWLYLGAAEGTVGAQYVYRVTTVGGASHGCSMVGEDSTSYTTQYWFFG